MIRQILFAPVAILLLLIRWTPVLEGPHPILFSVMLIADSVIRSVGLVYGPFSRLFEVECMHCAKLTVKRCCWRLAMAG